MGSQALLPLSLLLMATLSPCQPQKLAFTKPEQCNIINRPSDFKFCITRSRNETGHWTAQARLNHATRMGQLDDRGPWQVDLKQTTMNCGLLKSVQIVATLTEPCPTTRPSIPPGYELYPRVGYYNFHTTPKTWDQARKICEEEGGYLAIINSEEESKLFQELIIAAGTIEGSEDSNLVFLGFHDRFVVFEFMTIFGEPLGSTGFTRWFRSDEPDNYEGKERCGSMNANGGLNDFTCDAPLAFICEREI